jgi:hypothetical protein
MFKFHNGTIIAEIGDINEYPAPRMRQAPLLTHNPFSIVFAVVFRWPDHPMTRSAFITRFSDPPHRHAIRNEAK